MLANKKPATGPQSLLGSDRIKKQSGKVFIKKSKTRNEEFKH